MADPRKDLIPLSEAAKHAGVTTEHLNLLSRQGKIKAQKIGRNWFTSRSWVDQYFKGAPDVDTPSDEAALRLEIRRLEKEERIELARLRKDVDIYRIDKKASSSDKRDSVKKFSPAAAA